MLVVINLLKWMTSNKNKKRNVCVVVASRANYGRIKSTLVAINKHPKLH